MSGLNLVMACANEAPCAENFLTSPGSEKSNIIAFALAKKGALLTDSVSEALLSDGTTDPSDVIGIVRALQLEGKAFYFPSGRLNGKKPKPEEKMASQAFGLRTDAAPTGDVTNMLQFTYEYFFSTQTVKWFNWLRKNLEQYDAVYWTESKVHIIEGKDLTFHNIGYEITGNAGETIYGGFDVKYLGDGEPVPYGPIDNSLLLDFTTLTISNPTLDALKLALATCSSTCNVFKAVAGGALSTTLQFAVTGNASCLTWELYPDCSPTTVLVGDTAQINAITGLVTVTAQAANVKKKYTVMAISDSCVVGSYCMEIVTTPA